MAITPEDAGKQNDAIIRSEVERLEAEIDAQITDVWYSGAGMMSIPAPEVPDSRWEEQILTALANKYVEAGWKIEKRHDPKLWIFKRMRQ